MAPAAVLYDYRVFGAAGDMDPDTAVATSIRHAVDKTKCHVIQLASSVSYPVRTDVRKAIQYAYQRGVHILCAASSAAGANDTTQDTDQDLSGVAERYSYPAMMKETISVAPLRRDDGFVAARKSTTYYGNPLTTANNCSSINNYSGIGTNVVSFQPGGGFQTMSGASMAVPHVTGLIACLLSNSEGPSSKALYNSSNGKLRKLLETSYVLDIGDLRTTDDDDAAGSFYPDGTGGNRFLTYSAAKTNQAEFLDLLSAAVPWWNTNYSIEINYVHIRLFLLFDKRNWIENEIIEKKTRKKKNYEARIEMISYGRTYYIASKAPNMSIFY